VYPVEAQKLQDVRVGVGPDASKHIFLMLCREFLIVSSVLDDQMILGQCEVLLKEVPQALVIYVLRPACHP
jgi:hypothetical protein